MKGPPAQRQPRLHLLENSFLLEFCHQNAGPIDRVGFNRIDHQWKSARKYHEFFRSRIFSHLIH
jgi:hypothetical protein